MAHPSDGWGGGGARSMLRGRAAGRSGQWQRIKHGRLVQSRRARARACVRVRIPTMTATAPPIFASVPSFAPYVVAFRPVPSTLTIRDRTRIHRRIAAAPPLRLVIAYRGGGCSVAPAMVFRPCILNLFFFASSSHSAPCRSI